MAKLQIVTFFLTRLWQPFADSVQGKLSVKEVVAAICLTIIYLIFGGEVNEVIKQLLVSVDVTNFDPTQVVDALVILVVALLHRKSQGK